MTSNTIAISSDHAGVELKSQLVAFLKTLDMNVIDLGPHTMDSVDYPDFANHLCANLLEGLAGRGILICGSGIGMSIAANRHPHIRAALVQTPEVAGLSRQHNDANVLCLGARFVDTETAKACVKTFLTTKFEGGRHANRVAKLG